MGGNETRELRVTAEELRLKLDPILEILVYCVTCLELGRDPLVYGAEENNQVTQAVANDRMLAHGQNWGHKGIQLWERIDHRLN